VEELVDSRLFSGIYSGKTVFLTGHTGFKGAWLAEWLTQLGASVTGFSNELWPPPSLFAALGLENRVRHVIGDVRNAAAIHAAVADCQPDFVFHLAAQSLVRRSYSVPTETFAVNVMGTVNLLDAVRHLATAPAVVVVTSDKCYENREWIYGYREEDQMGGHDPYSASKGCAELVASSFRRSFFQTAGSAPVATARAGNVIGGGDWAEDRILPDCIRSLMNGQPITARRPAATRPWQHVLEPLSGYLWLGALLASGSAESSAYNFGPERGSTRNVGELVSEVLKHWPGTWTSPAAGGDVHEAGLLSLAIDKAHHSLRWRPVWSFERAVEATVEWYRAVTTGQSDALHRTHADISQYCESAQALGLEWARG